jgi:hypothetical protein
MVSPKSLVQSTQLLIQLGLDHRTIGVDSPQNSQASLMGSQQSQEYTRSQERQSPPVKRPRFGVGPSGDQSESEDETFEDDMDFHEEELAEVENDLEEVVIDEADRNQGNNIVEDGAEKSHRDKDRPKVLLIG